MGTANPRHSGWLCLELPVPGWSWPHQGKLRPFHKVPLELPTLAGVRASPHRVLLRPEFTGCSISRSCKQNQAPSTHRSRAVVLGAVKGRASSALSFLCPEPPLLRASPAHTQSPESDILARRELDKGWQGTCCQSLPPTDKIRFQKPLRQTFSSLEAENPPPPTLCCLQGAVPAL